MSNDVATLVLTRPEARSAHFLALCERHLGRRLPSIISPVIDIVDYGNLPDLTDYQTLVLTSASAVDQLAKADALRGRNVVTVGAQTAERARAQGAQARCFGDTVEAFVANADGLDGPLLHCRGMHTRGDLAARLTAMGMACDEVVVYDQVSRALSPAARRVLNGGEPVVLPLFSPRTAQLVARAGPFRAPLHVIAMSEAVAEAWPDAKNVAIAREPTNDAMCEAVVSAF